MCNFGGSSMCNMPSLWAARRAAKTAHCHLTCKEHTSFQKCNSSAEAQGGSCCSADLPSINHTNIKDIAVSHKRTSPLRCHQWKPYCGHWAPKRGEWARVTPLHFSAMGWLAPFTLLFKQLGPQKSYRLLQRGEAPAHRVEGDEIPAQKPKHLCPWLQWLIDIKDPRAEAWWDHKWRHDPILFFHMFLQQLGLWQNRLIKMWSGLNNLQGS